MKELAEFLKNERLKCDLTLEALSELSGISVSMLDSFENFNFERFGACILLRNAVRAYCNALHLDADALLGKYSSQIEACNIQEAGLRKYERLQKKFYKRRRMIALPILVFLLASVTVYYGGVWVSKRRSKLFAPPNANRIFSQENLPVDLQEVPASARKKTAAKPAPHPVSVARAAKDAPGQKVGTQKPVGKPVEKAAVAPGNVNNQAEASQKATVPDTNGALTQFSLVDPSETLAGDGPVQNAEANTLNRFTVQADRKVWIQVTIDGQKSRSEMLHAGDHREWVVAKSLKVVIGDAGGVHMQWNGQPLQAPRVSGRVLRFRLPDYAKPAPG